VITHRVERYVKMTAERPSSVESGPTVPGQVNASTTTIAPAFRGRQSIRALRDHHGSPPLLRLAKALPVTAAP
jgi:hypothetical protein